jgi:carboxyl-terminal processing protease
VAGDSSTAERPGHVTCAVYEEKPPRLPRFKSSGFGIDLPNVCVGEMPMLPAIHERSEGEALRDAIQQSAADPQSANDGTQPAPYSRRQSIQSKLMLLGLILSLCVAQSCKQQPPWKTHVLHQFRVTFELPPGYEQLLHQTYYQGPDGVVQRFWYTIDTPLSRLCKEHSSVVRDFIKKGNLISEIVNLSKGPVCFVTSEDGSEPYSAVIIPYPAPQHFRWSSATIYDLIFIINKKYLRQFAERVNFAASLSPTLYVEGVFELLKSTYYLQKQIDWNALHQEMLASLSGNNTLDGAHKSIDVALSTFRELNDHHSYFELPAEATATYQGQATNTGIKVLRRNDGVIYLVYPNSPGAKAGLRVGDVVQTVNGEPLKTYTANPADKTRTFVILRKGAPSPLTITVTLATFLPYVPAIGRRLIGNMGYIETLGIDGDQAIQQRYATETQQVIGQVDSPARCGWIVDVRRNEGGKTAAIFSGIAPIIGEKQLFGTSNGSGDIIWTTYEGGLFSVPGTNDVNLRLVNNPYVLKEARPPIAILTTEETASGGEFTAIALLKRPGAETRIFGEHTAGSTTILHGFWLFDDAYLSIATSAVTDRTENTYLTGIEPDEKVSTDFSAFGTDDDPVLQAAAKWLSNQPRCK